jgi:hypothetical protein
LLTFGFRLTWILSLSRGALRRQAFSSAREASRLQRTEINLDDSAQQKKSKLVDE